MEITKREILFSAIIVCIMIGLGIWLSNPIVTSVTDKALKTTSAIQVKDSTKFDYIRRTNVGDFLGEGELIAAEPVFIEDIQGIYGKIIKYKEEYTEHTRTVTETDSKGNVHTHTETYWDWDVVKTWEWESSNVIFLGQNFTTKQIRYRWNPKYQETIKPKVGFFETEIRYEYYTAPITDYGVLFGIADNKSYNDLKFRSGQSITKIVENAQNNINSAPIVFWVLWIMLTVGFVFLFYYAENNWLYDEREYIDRGY